MKYETIFATKIHISGIIKIWWNTTFYSCLTYEGMRIFQCVRGTHRVQKRKMNIPRVPLTDYLQFWHFFYFIHGNSNSMGFIPRHDLWHMMRIKFTIPFKYSKRKREGKYYN